MSVLINVINAINNNDQTHYYTGLNLSEIKYNTETDEIKIVKDCSTIMPKIQMHIRGKYIVTELIFKRAMDSDLSILWNIFTHYGKAMDKYSEDLECDRKNPWVPSCTLCLAPSEFDKYGMLTLGNPIFWSLTSDSINSKGNNIIAIVYDMDSVFLEKDSVDMQQVISEATREVEQEEYMKEMEEKQYIKDILRKEEEKAEFETEMELLLQDVDDEEKGGNLL